MECPSGSERDKEDPQQGVCRCSGQLVTSEGRNSTSDVTVPCGSEFMHTPLAQHTYMYM